MFLCLIAKTLGTMRSSFSIHMLETASNKFWMSTGETFWFWKSRKLVLAYKWNWLPFSQESPDHPSKQSHTPVVFLQTPRVVWSLIQFDGHAEESKKYLNHIMIWDNMEAPMLHSSSHSMFVHPIVCLFVPLCPNIYLSVQIQQFFTSHPRRARKRLPKAAYLRVQSIWRN